MNKAGQMRELAMHNGFKCMNIQEKKKELKEKIYTLIENEAKSGKNYLEIDFYKSIEYRYIIDDLRKDGFTLTMNGIHW